MPREKAKKGVVRGGAPLEVQLREDVTVESQAKAKAERRRKFMGKGADELDDEGLGDFDDVAHDEEDDTYIPTKISRKILNEARQQQHEDGADLEYSGKGTGAKKSVRFGGAIKSAASASSVLRSKPKDDDEEEEEEEIIEFADDDDVHLEGDFIGGMNEDAIAADEELLRRFMPDAPTERRTLADIIMEKIKENEEKAAALANPEPGLDPKVVEVYTEVGRYLSHYKSGKLPKVFKIIPGLPNWEEILFLTNPETWTPHATYAATRIFVSSFNPAKAQRFLNLIVYPKCRDDIYFNKRLNFHLYLSLKKSTYKPAAFFKGVILPLANEPDATLREAIIFGSVISKVSIPQIHAAATMIKLTTCRYNGAVSALLRTFINKKYTLPFMVIDALVEHFAKFSSDSGSLPIIWHQCLLNFVQRYKGDLTADQKEQLRVLMHAHSHHAITPEVRRELFSVGCRGDAPSIPVTATTAPSHAAKPSTMAIDY